MGASFDFQKCTDMQADLIIEAPPPFPPFPFSLRSASPLSMSTTLPSPGQEQTIGEDAETLRTALGAWVRQKGTKFEKKMETLEECVDENRWIHVGPFRRKVGLQEKVLREID